MENTTTRDAVSLDRAVEYLAELDQRIDDAHELIDASFSSSGCDEAMESNSALLHYRNVARETVHKLFDIRNGELNTLVREKRKKAQS